MTSAPDKNAAMQPRAPHEPAPSAPDPARRAFLMAAPLGALAVMAAGQADAAQMPVPAPPLAPGPRGYHETEHIRRYYRTAAYW
jgi:hypothetical protein